MAKKKKQGQQFLSPEQYLRQKARTLEIGKCYISEGISELGEGFVVVTRKHTGGRVSLAHFLVDTFCVGVKDSFYRLRLEDYEVEDMIAMIPYLRECSYVEAHNRIWGAVDFAREAGIEPDKSFNLTQYMLEEDTDDVPLIEYEYGKDGQHFLVCKSNLEASRYLPLLKKNLGEGNFKYLIADGHFPYMNDDDFLEDDAVDDDEFGFEGFGCEVDYTYKHPVYPSEIHLHYPWLQQELAKEENSLALKKKLLERILALPYDELRQDLEQIILYNIGLTCDGIPDDYEEENYNGTIANSIILLGEVGNDTSSLEVVLEVMRQSEEFYDYHISDGGNHVFLSTLYQLGQHRLELLMDYVKEEGLYIYAKAEVFPVLVQVALHQPERRQEVLAWFRDVIHFATADLPSHKSFSPDLAGLMVCDLVDLQAAELLPDIREMFETGMLSPGVCGTYQSVARDICDKACAGQLDVLTLDVRKRFDELRRIYK